MYGLSICADCTLSGPWHLQGGVSKQNAENIYYAVLFKTLTRAITVKIWTVLSFVFCCFFFCDNVTDRIEKVVWVCGVFFFKGLVKNSYHWSINNSNTYNMINNLVPRCCEQNVLPAFEVVKVLKDKALYRTGSGFTADVMCRSGVKLKRRGNLRCVYSRPQSRGRHSYPCPR